MGGSKRNDSAACQVTLTHLCHNLNTGEVCVFIVAIYTRLTSCGCTLIIFISVHFCA